MSDPYRTRPVLNKLTEGDDYIPLHARPCEEPNVIQLRCASRLTSTELTFAAPFNSGWSIKRGYRS